MRFAEWLLWVFGDIDKKEKVMKKMDCVDLVKKNNPPTWEQVVFGTNKDQQPTNEKPEELTPMVQYINGKRVVKMVPKNYGRERPEYPVPWEPSFGRY